LLGTPLLLDPTRDIVFIFQEEPWRQSEMMAWSWQWPDRTSLEGEFCGHDNAHIHLLAIGPFHMQQSRALVNYPILSEWVGRMIVSMLWSHFPKLEELVILRNRNARPLIQDEPLAEYVREASEKSRRANSWPDIPWRIPHIRFMWVETLPDGTDLNYLSCKRELDGWLAKREEKAS
jgi:hypothetical protein